tara:strand:- start:72 stop:695 length:624 start_codon:yes stop_codon:yes gene_type:complete
MNKFPKKAIKTTKSYAEDYLNSLANVSKKIDFNMINKLSDLLLDYYLSESNIFVCGNGGSAAISNHFLCDHLKSTSTNTNLLPKIFSLSSSMELITAIANDIQYDEIFAFQLSRLGKKGDCLITISSSGNSKNIINAIKWAKKNKLKTISLNGFNGGKAKKLSDLSINVPSNNYGIIEDLHQSIMHILSQSLRMQNSNRKNLSKLII